MAQDQSPTPDECPTSEDPFRCTVPVSKLLSGAALATPQPHKLVKTLSSFSSGLESRELMQVGLEVVSFVVLVLIDASSAAAGFRFVLVDAPLLLSLGAFPAPGSAECTIALRCTCASASACLCVDPSPPPWVYCRARSLFVLFLAFDCFALVVFVVFHIWIARSAKLFLCTFGGTNWNSQFSFSNASSSS